MSERKRRNGIGAAVVTWVIAGVVIFGSVGAGVALGNRGAARRNAEILSLREEVAGISAEVTATTVEVDRLTGQAAETSEALEAAETSIEVLTSRIETLTIERDAYRDKALDYKRQIDSLKREIAPSKSTPKASGVVPASGKWSTALVSWYGPGFYGHTMAGGGTLTRTSRIVAHRTLPFGTIVEFNANGKTIRVPVTDRGPYVAGRMWDLGPGTAAALDFFHTGRIRYRIVSRPGVRAKSVEDEFDEDAETIGTDPMIGGLIDEETGIAPPDAWHLEGLSPEEIAEVLS